MADNTPNPNPPVANPPKPATAAPAPAPAPAKPAAVRDDKGRLTRHGMEQAIRGGGSVLHDGRTITRVQDLPSEAELAQGDTAAEEAARASIAERQAQLDRERAILDGRRADAAKKK